MDSARMVADSRELLRLCVRGVVGIQNGLGRPDTYVAVYRGRVSSIRGCSASRGMSQDGLTNLRRPWPGAIHQAKRGSCKLQSLSVRLVGLNVSNTVMEEAKYARRCTHLDVLTTVV
jgi:hypothetical protein